MSGLGPAACWLAHKRIETWSRMAKERVGAVRRASEKSEPSTPPPFSSPSHMPTTSTSSVASDSQNDSNSSTEVRGFHPAIIFVFLI